MCVLDSRFSPPPLSLSCLFILLLCSNELLVVNSIYCQRLILEVVALGAQLTALQSYNVSNGYIQCFSIHPFDPALAEPFSFYLKELMLAGIRKNNEPNMNRARWESFELATRTAHPTNSDKKECWQRKRNESFLLFVYMHWLVLRLSRFSLHFTEITIPCNPQRCLF